MLAYYKMIEMIQNYGFYTVVIMTIVSIVNFSLLGIYTLQKKY